MQYRQAESAMKCDVIIGDEISDIKSHFIAFHKNQQCLGWSKVGFYVNSKRNKKEAISVWMSLDSLLSKWVIGEYDSEWMDETSGVPQGLVLGPLIFLYYINDLPDRWTNESKLYADESKLLGKNVNTNEGVRKM